jgi:hypothetical protein
VRNIQSTGEPAGTKGTRASCVEGLDLQLDMLVTGQGPRGKTTKNEVLLLLPTTSNKLSRCCAKDSASYQNFAVGKLADFPTVSHIHDDDDDVATTGQI